MENLSQGQLEKELITMDYHGKSVKFTALVEIMSRQYKLGLSYGNERIKALEEENKRLISGEVLSLRAENMRLRAQINNGAAKRINSFR